jgi:type III pantothenate kinase
MNRPLVAVDIGNSTIQIGLFPASCTPTDRSLPPPQRVIELGDQQSLDALVQWLPSEPCCWRIASVQRESLARLKEWIGSHRTDDESKHLQHGDLPLKILVDEPEKVGMDRLLAAVGANQIRDPARAAVIVDAGSAITVDLVRATGEFEGGVILAGFQMSADALAKGTDLLPQVGFSPRADPPSLIGKSTVEAIRSGLFWGNVGAIRFLISQVSETLDHPPDLIVTGGDARWMAPLLTADSESPQNLADDKNDRRFESHLVLAGILLTEFRAERSSSGQIENGKFPDSEHHDSES